MQKSLRSFALIATFAFAVVPAVRADQTGCNPHPWPNSITTFIHTVMSFFGA